MFMQSLRAFWLQTFEVLFRLVLLSLDPACHHHRRRSIGREIGRLTHKSKKLPNGGIERMGREARRRSRPLDLNSKAKSTSSLSPVARVMSPDLAALLTSLS